MLLGGIWPLHPAFTSSKSLCVTIRELSFSPLKANGVGGRHRTTSPGLVIKEIFRETAGETLQTGEGAKEGT